MFDRHRREGKKWRARCPVHKSKGLTLAIYQGDDRVSVHCFAGCDSDDILAAVGLTWKDCVEKRDTKAWREAQKARKIAEARASNLRVGDWILRFIDQGYTRGDYLRDVVGACFWAQLLSMKDLHHRSRGLANHMERIMAAQHCKDMRIPMGLNRKATQEWPR
jgi:hypothetical protein